MSNYITVEREAFERLCSLIRESHSVSEGINDQNAATNSTYSSTKIEEMLNDIIAEANTAVSEVDEKAEEALAIAKGKNRAHIFLTTEAMQAALSDEVNKDSYSVGDNLYIVDTEVPDWWIVEVLDQPDPDTGYYYKVAQLETQKVDLTDIIESIELANEEIEKLNEEAATHVPNTRTIAGIDLTEDIVADELRDNLPDFTSTSDSYMTNSKAGGLEIKRIAGGVKQTRYEGKNLLPYPYAHSFPRVNRGITFEDYDRKGGIIANGVADTTDQPYFMCSSSKILLKLKANQVYTLAGNCSDENGFAIIYFRDLVETTTNVSITYTEIRNGVQTTVTQKYISEFKGGVISNGVTFIPSQDIYAQLDVRFDSKGETVEDAVFHPQLELGTEVTEWEPWVGGTASPNVDYPQEIKNSVVSEIKSEGKNLLPYPHLDTSKVRSGITWTDIGDGTVMATGTNGLSGQNIFSCRTRNEVISPLILKPGTYTVSGCPSGGSISTYYIQVGKTLNGAWCTLGIDYGEGTTFTITEDTQIQIQSVIGGSATVSNIIFKPMLQLGSEATEYEPYKTSTAKVAFTGRAIEVDSNIDYTYEKDGRYYVADTIEKTDTGYQLVQRVLHLVFDGTEEWETWPTNATGKRMAHRHSKLPAYADFGNSWIKVLECSHMQQCLSESTQPFYEYETIALHRKDPVIQLYASKYQDLDSWKAFLAEQYANGTPFTVDIVAVEPIIIPLSNEDAIALMSLKTFDEATYISTDSEVEALIDTTYGVSEAGARILKADNTASTAERLPDFASTSDSYMPNSKAGGLSIERIAGVVKQDKYEGKQLIPYPYSNMTRFEADGITLTVYEDGTILAKGTCTATTEYASFYIQELSLTNGETYTFSDESLPNADAYTRLLAYKDNTWVRDISDPSENSTTFVYDETVMDTVSLFIRVNSGVTVNMIFKPMLQLGSEATEWEPYVGGVPSPNVDYPQEIQNVDITEIKSVGKNLIDLSLYGDRTNQGVTATIKNQTMTLNGTATDAGALPTVETKPFPFKVKVGDILTISTTILSGSATIASNTSLGYCVIRVDREEVTRFSTRNIVSGKIDKDTKLKPGSLVITEDMISDDGFVYHTTQVYIRADDVYDNLVLGIQIELNSEATEWEPYNSSISTPAITCRAIEVLAVEDYTYEKDGKYYIADTVERTDEGYQLVQRIGEVVYGVDEIEYFIYYGETQGTDGSRFIMLTDTRGFFIHYRYKYSGDSIYTYCICDKFSVCESAGAYNMAIYQGGAIFFLPESVGIRSSTAAQEWVQANPITLHYILEEPIITPLSDSDAIALLSLKTFDEATHISTNSAADAVINTKYGVTEVGAMTLNADNTALRAELRTKMLEAAMVNNI